MAEVVLQMALLIVCGLVWRIIRPDGLDADPARRVLTGVVYYLLLPALVLDVLSHHPLGVETARISAFGTSVIIAGTALAWLLCRWLPMTRAQRGAALLAGAFPNVTFLGLPVLEQAFGPWARTVAVQIDLFAALPLALTLAVAIARHYGQDGTTRQNPLRALLRVPALWAMAAAVLLQRLNWPLSPWLDGALARMAAAVAPLMLVALGLSLRLDTLRWRDLWLGIPVLSLRLLLVPLLAGPLATALHFSGDTWRALILETAMPSMVVGIVLCDRFRLDSGFYATLVTAGTLASMATLPLWWRWFG